MISSCYSLTQFGFGSLPIRALRFRATVAGRAVTSFKTATMKTINLTKGHKTIVDDDDYEWLSKNKWCFHSKGYAHRRASIYEGKTGIIYMHREIAKPKTGEQTDHINGDKLDNRRENLRSCNNSQNQINQKIDRTNTTGFKGVFVHKPSGKFCAMIQKDKKRKYLGLFLTREAASSAYQSACVSLFGEFAA